MVRKPEIVRASQMRIMARARSAHNHGLLSTGDHLHEFIDSDFLTLQFSDLLSIPHDDHTVAITHDFFQFGCDENDSETFFAKLRDELFYFRFRTDIDSAS